VGSLRKVSTDKKDALKIAKYGLDNWNDLREYTPADALRQQLKLFSRQYNLYMKTSVAMQNNPLFKVTPYSGVKTLSLILFFSLLS